MEETFRQLSPDFRWLHLATHGFFYPKRGRRPGLNAGLALSGANAVAPSAGDDGVLTALEMSLLNLRHAELLVLSACETGLGRIQTGEGVLSLQRSCQVAGVRSTVTTLWKVDDRATQLLMTEFYRNLLDRDVGKLQALREAQLTMIKQYDPQLGKIRPRSADEPGALLSPFYWAAFVFSGDPR